MKSARLIAFETLHKIFTEGAYSHIVLDNALQENDCDKSFVSALVYGVTERKITLDYYINKYLKSKTKPKVMTVLRLGAYQILFMDKVPDSAAINESVKLVKEIKQDYYASLVNAVLHKICDDNESVDDLSIKYSIPQDLVNMWSKQYGKEITESFLPFVNNRPPVFAVANSLFVDSDELSYELLSEGIENEIINTDVVMITSAFDLKKSRTFNNGLFHIEDLSSYNCACAVKAKENDVVLDICSAPGGKAFTIAQKMNNKGHIYAFDLHASRVKQIESGAERLNISIIHASVNDALEFSNEIPMADRILCDVPCSGFGIIRRKPEIRYKSLDSISDMPQIQLKILETSSKYLKNNGTLVYSTCTLNKKENEKVVQSFLDKYKAFKLIEEKTVFPSEFGGDGFYYAVIKKYEN